MSKSETVSTMKFAITLEQGEDGYIVTSCPALPGCHSQGKTRQEAIANIKEAIEGCLLAARDLNLPITKEMEHHTPY